MPTTGSKRSAITLPKWETCMCRTWSRVSEFHAEHAETGPMRDLRSKSRTGYGPTWDWLSESHAGLVHKTGHMWDCAQVQRGIARPVWDGAQVKRGCAYAICVYSRTRKQIKNQSKNSFFWRFCFCRNNITFQPDSVAHPAIPAIIYCDLYFGLKIGLNMPPGAPGDKQI